MKRTIATIIATLAIAVPATAVAAGKLYQLHRGDWAHIVRTNIYCTNHVGKARCEKIQGAGHIPIGSYRLGEGNHTVRVAKLTPRGWVTVFSAAQ